MLVTAQNANAIVFSDAEGNELGSIVIDQFWDRCSFETVRGNSLPVKAGYVLDAGTMPDIVERDEYELYIVDTTEVVVDSYEAAAGYVTRVYAVDRGQSWPARCLACFCEYRWEDPFSKRSIGLELYQGGDEENPVEDLYALVLLDDGYILEAR